MERHLVGRFPRFGAAGPFHLRIVEEVDEDQVGGRALRAQEVEVSDPVGQLVEEVGPRRPVLPCSEPGRQLAQPRLDALP